MTDNHRGRAEASCEAYCTSGPSPTSLHLIGPGQVGQEVLQLLESLPLRLVGISDSSATLHRREGLDARELAAFKAQGGRLIQRLGAEDLPLDLAVDLVAADVVVDCSPTNLSDAASPVARARKLLGRGAHLALAAKDALCLAGPELLQLGEARRLGFNAVLGGTGLALRRELEELRRCCDEIAMVGNASTTAVIEALESGVGLATAIQRTQDQGILEPDPSLDFSGKDAATKLCAVAGLVFGGAPQPAEVQLPPDLRDMDAMELRDRRAAGKTTRLVGRARRGGGLQLAYETLPVGDPLACPHRLVVYSYRIDGGSRRVHSGAGIGPQGTAEAVLADLRDFIDSEGRQV